MNYYSSACPVLASTDGVAYELVITGCHQNCPGCHSPHLHDFNEGTPINEVLENEIVNDIKKYSDCDKIDNICIIGGEPLDQNHNDLIKFLSRLRTEFKNLGIWVYTSYDIKDVPTDVLKLTDYIKCGKYVEELKTDSGFKSEYGPTLATSNQYIVKSSDIIAERGV